MTVYDRSLYFGPDRDSGRYYSAAMGSTLAGDFALIFAIRLDSLYVGLDPTASQSIRTLLWQNYLTGAGTGGGNCYLRQYPANHSSTANRGKLELRLSSTGEDAFSTGTTLLGTTQFLTRGQTIIVVAQSVSGVIELRTCVAGSSTVVLENSITRNATYTTEALGTFNFGKDAFANTYQFAGKIKRALTDAEIIAFAAGTDPDTIVAAGDRDLFWVFNGTGATISPAWGATNLTQSGTWTNQAAAHPLWDLASSRIAVTNEPLPYGPVGVNDDGSAPTFTVRGTYTGYTPTAIQVRVENLNGTDAVAWTDLGSFTASAGVWSGTVTVPLGIGYRLQVRDKTTSTIIWRGAYPWNVLVTTLSTGQSQFTRFETKADTGTVITGTHYIAFPGIPEVFVANATSTGAGLLDAMSTYSTATGGKSLCHLIAAVVGTSSLDWANKTSNTWTPLLAMLDAIHPTRLLVMWLQGVSDNGVSNADIKTRLGTILSNFDADVTTTRGIAYRFKILPHNRDSGATISNRQTRVAQYEWARDHALAGSKVLLGPWWGDLITEAETNGTVSAATSTSVTLAGNTMPAGMTSLSITITGGTGVGQTRTISAWNATTKVATVAAWTTIPDTTSTYRTSSTASIHADARTIGTHRFGPRFGYDVAQNFGYSVMGGRGPVLAAATFPNGGDGHLLNVTVTHRHGSALQTPNGGASATGLAGWSVSDDNFATTKTITDARIVDATTVQLTLSAAPASPTALKVRYGEGEPVASSSWDVVGGGVGDLLYDNSAVAPTSGLPVYFTTTDLAVTEAPAAATSLVAAGFFALT